MSKTTVDIKPYLTQPGDYNVQVTAISGELGESNVSNVASITLNESEMEFVTITETTCKLVSPGTLSAFEIVIPETYNGRTVVAIGDRAFYANQMINKIVIPRTVLSIGQNAFSGCLNLHTVVAKDSQITEIGAKAFEGCTRLRNLSLPATLEIIDMRAFYNCKLDCEFEELFDVENINSLVLHSIGENAFRLSGLKGNCTLPPSLIDVGIGAFAETLINYVVITGNNTTIADFMFYNCSDLRSVNFGKTVSPIGAKAFMNCDKLAKIKIPSTTPYIAPNAFYGVDWMLRAYSGEDHPDDDLDEFDITDGWVFSAAYGQIDDETFYVPFHFNGVSIWELLINKFPDKYFWRLTKIPSPQITLDGDKVEIVDKSMWATAYNIHLNGEKVDTVNASYGIIRVGEYYARTNVSNDVVFRDEPLTEYIYFKGTLNGIIYTFGQISVSDVIQFISYDNSIKRSIDADTWSNVEIRMQFLKDAKVSAEFYAWFNKCFEEKIS